MRHIADAESKRVESDGEHVFSTALIAWAVMKKKNLKLDEAKVLKMALIHELGEIDFGDVTPFDNVSLKEKHLGEKNCVERLAKTYDLPEILSLWQEFEFDKSPEAKFVKQIDKFDAIMQSKIYAEQLGKEELFKEFLEYDRDNIRGFEDLLDLI